MQKRDLKEVAMDSGGLRRPEDPQIVPASKARPILFSALAWAEVLLTLDTTDFAALLGGAFYGLPSL